MKKRIFSAVGLLFLALSLILVGCGNTAGNADEGLAEIQSEALASTGTLILKVNPEIAIDYNDRGEVTEIRGLNGDGEEIIGNYADFIGKDSGIVLKGLIALIGEAGYFVEEIEGDSKHIVIELEPGSVLPTENFLELVATNAQRAVQDYKLNSDVTVEDQKMISLEEAKQIAFEHANVDGSQVRFDNQELDSDDGVLKYELEFDIGQNEYEYDIHAFTGEVLHFEHDIENREAETNAEKAPKATQTTNENKDKENANANTNQANNNKPEYISLERAKQIAFDHAGVNGADARFDDQEFDIDDGVPHYELEFKIAGNEYEYDIHAVSGKILKVEQDIKKTQTTKPAQPKEETKKPAQSQNENKKQSKPAAESAPKQLTRDQAINIALNHAGLSRVQVKFDDVELDHDDGRLLWEIEFDHGAWEYEYEVDAHSGSIIDFEKDHDD